MKSKIYKKNSYIQSMGLNVPKSSEQVIKNIYYNYTHKVIDTNSSYSTRELTADFNKRRFIKELNKENILYQSDVYVNDLVFDFRILNSMFCIKLVNSNDPIDVITYNNVAAMHNIQCYFVYDFDNYAKFVKALMGKYYIESDDVTCGNVDNSEAKRFYDKFSLYDIDLDYSISIGLKRNGSLVSCMTFHMVNIEDNTWKLSNFCSKAHYVVRNGSAVMMDYFIQNYDPKSIVSITDLTKSSGDMMQNLGFKFISHIDSDVIYTRYKCGISHNYIKYILPEVSDRDICDMMLNHEYKMVRNLGYNISIKSSL